MIEGGGRSPLKIGWLVLLLHICLEHRWLGPADSSCAPALLVDEANGQHCAVSPAGDANRDGCPDFLVSHCDATKLGRAWIVSGRDRGILQAFVGESMGDGFGCSLCGAGDIDHDGYDDVVIGSNGSGAYIFSGKTGGVLVRVSDPEWKMAGIGKAVAGGVDVNQDGYCDLLVGAPGLARRTRGRVTVVSGREGARLRVLEGDQLTKMHGLFRRTYVYDEFGTSVAFLGDVNSDGVSDIAVGAPGREKHGDVVGAVDILDGRNGARLFSILGDEPGFGLGWAVAGAGDINGDGTPDIVATCIHRYVTVVSGKDGRELWRAEYRVGDMNAFGSSIDRLGDLNSDGCSDIIVGANENGPDLGNDRGSATVYSGRDGTVLIAIEDPHDGMDVSRIGDPNTDGVQDYLVNLRDHKTVVCHSGRDGSILWEWNIQPRAQGAIRKNVGH